MLNLHCFIVIDDNKDIFSSWIVNFKLPVLMKKIYLIDER